MKTCSACKEALPLENFGRNKSRRDGLATECRACVKARDRRYKVNNREKMREKDKRRYWKNPEKARASSIKRKKARPDLHRAASQRYRLLHLEDSRKRSAKHRAKGTWRDPEYQKQLQELLAQHGENRE